MNRYDPADIPVLILKPGARRGVAFLIFRTGLVWDKERRRMLEPEEVGELFERLETGFKQALSA